MAPEQRDPQKCKRLQKDGILLIVTARVNGRKVKALVDSGATRCYVAAQAITRLGLRCVEVHSILELANGSKQLSRVNGRVHTSSLVIILLWQI